MNTVCFLSLAGITSLTLLFCWISSCLKLPTLPETSMRSPCSYCRSVVNMLPWVKGK